MKKIVASILCCGITFCAMAQKDGGLTPEMLNKIKQSYKPTAQDKALRNAVANNKIQALALNLDNVNKYDTYFSNRVNSRGITDQKSSGRCWMFSSFNVFRADFARHHADSLSVEFSHDYLFFYDQLEKANLMLQGVIDLGKKDIEDPQVQFFFKNPLNDGGTFCGVIDLAGKYGLVPMSAQPETFSSNNTSRMSRLVSSKLREYGLELRKMVADGKKSAAIQARKAEMLSQVYRMLSLTLGEPVKEFTYAFRDKDGKQVGEAKKYTPKSFYEETVGKSLDKTYISVMNDPRRPYHKTYEVEYDRHTYDGHNWKYLNLPMEEIANLAIASLKGGQKMYSSYDVGKQLDRKRGYLATDNFDYGTLFGTSFGMDKAQRISTFDSGSTHAMTLTAVDLDANGKPVKWKVENSWGADNGFSGCFIMTNDWFNEYMFRLVVDKKFASEQLQKEFDQKPTMLTPDDPLFQLED